MAELALLEVRQQMLEAVEQALALGLHRPLDHLRVGQREIGGRHRVDERPGGEAQLLAGLLVDALDRVDRAEQPLGDQQIGLADRVVERIVAPFRGGEAPVLVGFLGERGRGSLRRRPSARCQIDSPSVHSSACICMIFAGSPNMVIPGQAAAAFSGSGAAAAASPICCGEMLHHQLLGAPHHPGPMLHVLEAGRRERRRRRRVGVLGVGVGHDRGSSSLPALYRDRAPGRKPLRHFEKL